MRTRITALIGIALILGGCSDASKEPSTSTGPEPSLTATTSTASVAVDIDYTRYVEDAIGILELKFWRSADVDWDQFRASVLGSLSDSPSQAEAYVAVDTALGMLGDPHNWFRRPEEGLSTPSESDVTPFGEVFGDQVGYLFLPGTGGLSAEGFAGYATDINDAMRAADETSPVCGWVIDLRSNRGGSVHPMLFGLGPLLGEDTFLTFQGTHETLEFTYEGDALVLNDGPAGPVTFESDYLGDPPVPPGSEEGLQLDSPRYTPNDVDASVAILLSGETASAAEAVLVSFIGRENTRSFGMPTRGVPTGVEAFQFIDGATLGVAAAQAQDRNGRLYNDTIDPDERTADLYPLDDTDEVLETAITWIESLCP